MINTRVALAAIGLLLSPPAYAIGDPIHQEIGDVVYRSIDVAGFPISNHGAIYAYHMYPHLSSASPDPTAFSEEGRHNLLEMRGVTGHVGGIVTSVSRIKPADRLSFKAGSSSYDGAYTWAPRTPGRGAGGSPLTRTGIVEMADRLEMRFVPILYAVEPGEPLLALVTSYIEASAPGSDPADPLEPPTGGILTPDSIYLHVGQIERMRSDAYIEYCYAASGFPILEEDLSRWSNMRDLQDRAAAGDLFPLHQILRLARSDVDRPTITLLNGPESIPPSGTTNASAIDVEVFDEFSGPARLEVYRNGQFQEDALDPRAVGQPGIDDVIHTYSPPQLNPPQEGSYRIRAIDQAGNETSVTFTKLESAPPTFQMKNAAGVFAPLPAFVTPGTYEFEVGDSGSGIASFTSRHSGASATEQFSTPQPKITRTFTLTAGTLRLEATDAAGNGSAISLPVDPNPVKLVLASRGQDLIDTEKNPAVTSAVVVENAAVGIIVRSIDQPLQSLVVTREGATILSRMAPKLIS